MATSPTFESPTAQNFEPLPITGPTAQGMNQTNAQKMPQSQFDFNIRKGISNTAKQAINAGMKRKIDREIKSEFQKLLAKQEVGAKQLRDSAVKTYGQEIDEMLPPVDLFYDQKTGAFMPYKYAQAVTVGVHEFKKQKAEQAKIDEKRAKEELTLQGRKELQDYSAGFKGKTREEFKQGATQLPTFGSGGMESADINTAAGGYPAEKQRDPLADMRFQLSQMKFRYQKAQNKAEEQENIRKELKVQSKDIDTKYQKALLELKKVKSPKDEITGQPIEPDPEAIAEANEKVNDLKDALTEIKNAAKWTFITEEAARTGKPASATFMNADDVGGDISSIPITPNKLGPATDGGFGASASGPAIGGVDPIRQKAIELLVAEGITDHTPEMIDLVVSKLRTIK